MVICRCTVHTRFRPNVDSPSTPAQPRSNIDAYGILYQSLGRARYLSVKECPHDTESLVRVKESYACLSIVSHIIQKLSN